MGKVIEPMCFNCRHIFPKLYIGGGMINSRTVNDQPVYNKETETVETANVKQREKVLGENENLTFYDSEEMFRISLLSMTSIASMSMSKNVSSILKVLNCSPIANIVLS